ncbi:MAG: hypothetical protein ACHQM4_09530 [Thermoanaerobaculia bacterium]
MRPRRLPLVVLLACALALTGLCTSLSAGAAASCPVADAPDHDACCDQQSSETCPEAPTRPTCRTCDDTVAFLLKEKAAGDDVPSATFALAPTLAPRPQSAPPAPSEARLLSLSASPPIHLLNATFRN